MSRVEATNTSVQRLKDWLTKLDVKTDGSIAEDDVDELDGLLAAAWDDLSAGIGSGMKQDKLFGRMEKVRWEPPLLSFVIERHGGTVLGSTRAEIQEWEINLDTGAAIFGQRGNRQLKPMAPRINVTELARDVAQRIVDGRKDDLCLSWTGSGKVRVIATKVLPETEYKATQNSRSKKLWKVLEELLEPQGWRRDTTSTGGVFFRQSE